MESKRLAESCAFGEKLLKERRAEAAIPVFRQNRDVDEAYFRLRAIDDHPADRQNRSEELSGGLLRDS